MKHFSIVCVMALMAFGQEHVYTSDSLVVREILDLNGHDTVAVETVTDTSEGRITALILRFRDISRLPESICSLTALTTLDLYENMLEDRLPSSIGKLTNLTYLNLGVCWLRSLPDEVWDLTNLKYLNLALNYIGLFTENASLPTQFDNLTQLEYLNLRFNALETLPDEMVFLTKIDTLDLSGNKLCSFSSELELWADAHDPDWRETQDCTPVRRPLIAQQHATPFGPNATVTLHDLHGRLLDVMPFLQVNDRLNRMSSGTYLLVLPAGEGIVKTVVPGR